MKEITLKTGVVIKLKPVGPLIVREAVRTIVPPRVPVQFIESKSREEENPMHPDYLAAMEDYENKRAEAVENTMLLFGTEVVSIPESMHESSANGWTKDLESVGIKISSDSRLRYVQWLKLYAMEGDVRDFLTAMREVGRASGVLEEDAAEAAESFRGDEVRSTDNKARDKKAN